jgi:hypothetical protein
MNQTMLAVSSSRRPVLFAWADQELSVCFPEKAIPLRCTKAIAVQTISVKSESHPPKLILLVVSPGGDPFC